MEKIEKKNAAKEAAKEVVQPNAHANKLPTAEELAARKAKKAESAKAWLENKKKEDEQRRKDAADLLAFLKEKKVELKPEHLKVLNDIANPQRRGGGNGGSPLLNKLFGDTPKVGDEITLREVFERTFKSKAEIDRQIKVWKEKGIIVEFTQLPDFSFSTYTITAIGAEVKA